MKPRTRASSNDSGKVGSRALSHDHKAADRAAAKTHASRGRTGAKRSIPASTYTVLIVEDDLNVRQSLGDLFELAGYHVLLAVNGRDALGILQTTHPDLIISDIMMPEMDGITFLRRLRSNRLTSLIPVILLTANHLMDTRLEGLTSGADDYLTKPFHARELVMRAGNMIQTRKQLLVSLYSTPSLIVSESQDETFLRRLTEVIESSISDSTLCLDAVCDRMQLSRSTIQKRLKRITGRSFNIFLREFRLERADKLIEQNAGSISDIAWQVGFNSLAYFSRSYKLLFGHAPTRRKQ